MSKRREKDYQKVCVFCENATVLMNGNDILCKHKGVVSEDFVCRKFIYDPLKRKPVLNPNFQTLSKDDLL